VTKWWLWNLELECSHVQDFEGITPNLLARTIETVEGGGAVVMLISTLRSLKQLFTLTMDAHTRLKTESHQTVRGMHPLCHAQFLAVALKVIMLVNQKTHSYDSRVSAVIETQQTANCRVPAT
jgi:tRNA(Met) C34 N-acetyltransferase TmcA